MVRVGLPTATFVGRDQRDEIRQRTARDAAAGIVENVVAAAGMVDRQDRNARSTAAPAQKADQQVQPIERMARTVACNSRSRNATRFVSDGLAYLRQR